VGPLRSEIYAQRQAEYKAESEARRERVLKYPDLAKRLTEPPLSFRTPQDWNGYVPPKTDPQDACDRCSGHGRDQISASNWKGRQDPPRCRNPNHTTRMNNSSRRAALVAIAAEAKERERAR
jgi:hypothetical protein